jgi:hypothetical protein
MEQQPPQLGRRAHCTARTLYAGISLHPQASPLPEEEPVLGHSGWGITLQPTRSEVVHVPRPQRHTQADGPAQRQRWRVV